MGYLIIGLLVAAGIIALISGGDEPGIFISAVLVIVAVSAIAAAIKKG